ncbi:MAG: HAD family hydrolase [Myxococcota bacterium]|nr:HAD family hydrolase [Myxococcota bacterium]
MSTVAFFDIDKTLLAIHSGNAWVWSEYRKGFLSRRKLVEALYGLVKYGLGLSSVEPMIRRAIDDYSGVLESDISARTDVFFEQHIRRAIRPGAFRALRHHQALGHQRVILSASTSYVAHQLSEYLDLDGVICTRLEVDSTGCFTGRPIEPLCYGRGKITAAQLWLKRHGSCLDDAYFYTDSVTDLPMLRMVGHPVVVNPDIQLKRHAQRVDWPIVDWGLAPA